MSDHRAEPVAVTLSGWTDAPLDLPGETVFAIGDAHGCARELEALLGAIAGTKTPPHLHRELTGQDDPHRLAYDRLGLDGGTTRTGIVAAARIEHGRYRIFRAAQQQAA